MSTHTIGSDGLHVRDHMYSLLNGVCGVPGTTLTGFSPDRGQMSEFTGACAHVISASEPIGRVSRNR